jgi:UDP-GlcNAc:undecaprenyl-phosphate GlcNAc-1-phosphate transferase
VGALCAAMFLASSLLSGQAVEGLLFSCLTGALLAFLAFNFPPARMFMGDGGSLVVGYALGWGSLRLTYFDAGFRLESPWYAVFTPLVVLAIPLYDLVTVITLRLLDRRSPLRGDNLHFLHRLSRRGLGPRGVLLLVGAATLATGIGGVMLSRLVAWQAVLVVLQSALTLVVLALLEIHLAGRDAKLADGGSGRGGRAPTP